MESRSRILASIAELSPHVLTVSEPSSNHADPFFEKRLEAAPRHYLPVFQVLDATLSPEDALAIKHGFFFNELQDVLAARTREQPGSERHEPVEVWLDRLERAGLRPEAPEQETPRELPGGMGLRCEAAPSGLGSYVGLQVGHLDALGTAHGHRTQVAFMVCRGRRGGGAGA